MSAALGLDRFLTQKVFASGELSIELPVQIVAVGQHDNGRRRHRLLQQLREEDHRKGLAAALRMPENAAFAIRPCSFHRRQYRLAHGVELVIGSQYLRTLLPVLRETQEIAYQLHQPHLVEHPPKQYVEPGTAPILHRTVDRFPRHKAVFSRRNRAGLGNRVVAHHTERIVDEERRNLLHVIAQLRIGLRNVGILARGRFQLHHDQRQTVDEDDDIRPLYRSLLDRPLVRYRKIISQRRIVVDEPHEFRTLLAAVEIVDRDTVLKIIGKLLVLLYQRTALVGPDLRDRLFDRRGRQGRIQLLHRRPQLLHVDRLRIIARDLRPIDIVVAQLLAEQLDYRIFKIGFGEVHKIDCINLIPSQNIYQSYLLNPL